MRWINNIRMMPKLIGSFAVVALLAALVGVTGVMGMNAIRTNLDQVTAVNVPNLNALRQVDADIGSAIRYTRGTAMTSNPTLTRTLIAQAQAERQDGLTQWKKYMALPFNNSAEAAIAARTQAEFIAWSRLDERVGYLRACQRVTAAISPQFHAYAQEKHDYFIF